MDLFLFLSQNTVDWTQVIVNAPIIGVIIWLMQRQNKFDEQRAKTDEQNAKNQAESTAATNRLARLIGMLVLLHELKTPTIKEDVERTFREMDSKS